MLIHARRVYVSLAFRWLIWPVPDGELRILPEGSSRPRSRLARGLPYRGSCPRFCIRLYEFDTKPSFLG